MKMYEKTLSFFLLLLSFTLLLTDCKTFSFFDTQTLKTTNICTDISDWLEHSHSHTTEDNVIIIETKSKAPYLLLKVEVISNSDANLKSNFVSKIWQPPKFS